MAFRAATNMIVCTRKQIVIVELWSSKKMTWFTIPYTTIKTFRVKSVKSSDTDTDLKLYFNSYWIDGGVSSVIELYNCIASSITIHNCVSHHIIGLADQSTFLQEHVAPINPVSLQNLFAMLKKEEYTNDDKDKLHHTQTTSAPILIEQESVLFQFHHGHKFFVLTNERIIYLDEKRLKYMSYPFRYCHAFQIQTSRCMLMGDNVNVYTSIPEKEKFHQNLLATME